MAACLAAVLLLAGVPAHAVGLGEVKLDSALNDPLEARITLRGLGAGELDGLTARLAPEDAFEREGIPRTHLLTRLQFTTVSTGERRGYIRVTSRDIIREPSLSFIVEVSSLGRVVQRRYDLLLNPR
jgi:pilus assembly protein FimV